MMMLSVLEPLGCRAARMLWLRFLKKFAREERGKALRCSSTFSSIQHHSFMKRANILILLYFTYIILASSGGKSEEVGESPLER